VARDEADLFKVQHRTAPVRALDAFLWSTPNFHPSYPEVAVARVPTLAFRLTKGVQPFTLYSRTVEGRSWCS
jgi:hypothetical protein